VRKEAGQKWRWVSEVAVVVEVRSAERNGSTKVVIAVLGPFLLLLFR